MHRKVCVSRRIVMPVIMVIVVLSLLVFFAEITRNTNTAYQSRASVISPPPVGNVVRDHIIGGSQVSDHTKWPFIVHIKIKDKLDLLGINYGTHCTGSLIDPSWVLTAGHCVSEVLQNQVVGMPENPLINKNRFRLTMADGTDYAVAEVIRKSDYGKPNTTSNDVALFRLQKPVQLTDSVQTITLSAYANLGKERDVGVLIGYGMTKVNNTSSTGVLNMGILPILAYGRLNKSIWMYPLVYSLYSDEGFIFSGYPLGGVGTCNGDSGGPILVYDYVNKLWKQIGVSSRYSGGCGASHSITIHARTSYSIEWIGEQMWEKKTDKDYLTCVSKGDCRALTGFVKTGTFVKGVDIISSDDVKEMACRLYNTPKNGTFTSLNQQTYQCGDELAQDDLIPTTTPFPTLSPSSH